MLGSLLRSIIGRRAPTNLPSEHAQQAASAAPHMPQATYKADGFSTTHDASFLSDALFQESYRLGAESGHRICSPEDLHIEWRVYTCCWAARHALRVDGDFAECGVSTGIVSRAVAHYVDFASQQKNFWLIDTFDGIPLDQANVEEKGLAQSKNMRHYFDCHAEVVDHFERYDNVRVVKGRVPEVLSVLPETSFAFVHIDMNIAEPEVAALRHFWNRMSPGGVVVLDDYGSRAHRLQKIALDEVAFNFGEPIFTLPTGQGLLVKP